MSINTIGKISTVSWTSLQLYVDYIEFDLILPLNSFPVFTSNSSNYTATSIKIYDLDFNTV